MTTKDLNIIDNLLTRINNLPDILHLRAADIGYNLTEDDKKLLLETYEKLDDILKGVAAFINVIFPGREDHIKAWNEIDFNTKIGNIKIITTDREHKKRAWRTGLLDLKSLLKCLRNELVLLIDKQVENSYKDVKTNNFSGNIIYNESKVTGKQIQSSSPSRQTKNTVNKPPKTATQIIKEILIGLFITIIGGLLLWFITAALT
jgi:hypothetical protein